MAEYSGAIAGLKKAVELGCKHILLFSLKTGRDEFSQIRGETLAQRIPHDIKGTIADSLRPDKDQKFVATVYRWYLCGLAPALSLRKCKVDAEVAVNVSRGR